MSGRVVDLELSDRVAIPREARDARPLYVLLRSRGRPVGRLVLERPDALDDAAFLAATREAAAPGLATLSGEPAGMLAPEAVTVVIATRDRPESLTRTLEALARLDPPAGEVVVSDSASGAAKEVEDVAAAGGARLVRCDRPGLSLARNRGAEAAQGAVVAFLDDDCLPDPGWLGALCRGFADPTVEAVTGQLLPAELETEAQVLFLRYAHMDRRGFSPRRFTLAGRESRSWPIDAWRMGSGGNLVVRAAVFRRLGGFRLDLGLGTAALGGEDLFLLWSVITGGGAVVYRPDAMAWHRHHRTRDALRQVLYGYGAGHSAYLRAVHRAGASSGPLARYVASFLVDRLGRIGHGWLGLSPVPASLVWQELRGCLAGARS